MIRQLPQGMDLQDYVNARSGLVRTGLLTWNTALIAKERLRWVISNDRVADEIHEINRMSLSEWYGLKPHG